MGFLLLLPLIFIRYGLLAMLDKGAVSRAAHFAPMEKNEQAAYWIYQLSGIAIFICPLFLQIKFKPKLLFVFAIIIYAAGAVLLLISIVNFAYPSQNGINTNGFYRFSRNPMYVSYFIYFIGCAMLIQSFVFLGIVLLFQISAHRIIISEERWCVKSFGEEYLLYMENVRRYI